MKKSMVLLVISLVLTVFASCAHYPHDRYNTQKGALIGAGAGALLGQAIGGNTAGTLIGLAAGTIFGGLVGNAVDQDYQAARDAVRYDKPVVYYDEKGSAVEAIPEPVRGKGDCRKVTKRVWENGTLVSETVEEVCKEPSVVVVEPRYVYPAYPVYPRFHFYYRYGPPYKYYHRPYFRHW